MGEEVDPMHEEVEEIEEAKPLFEEGDRVEWRNRNGQPGRGTIIGLERDMSHSVNGCNDAAILVVDCPVGEPAPVVFAPFGIISKIE